MSLISESIVTYTMSCIPTWDATSHATCVSVSYGAYKLQTDWERVNKWVQSTPTCCTYKKVSGFEWGIKKGKPNLLEPGRIVGVLVCALWVMSDWGQGKVGLRGDFSYWTSLAGNAQENGEVMVK